MTISYDKITKFFTQIVIETAYVLLLLFCNTRGLLQYVVHITMHAQLSQYVIVIATQWRRGKKIAILQPIHVLLQYTDICLQQYLWLVPHVRIVAIYVPILPQRFILLQYLVSIATKWLIHATRRNCRNITTILQRWYNSWQYVASIATKGVLSAMKQNSGNMLILLRWNRILG